METESADDDPYSDYGKPTGAYAESLRKSAERRKAKLIAKAQTEHSAPMVGTMAERAERDKQRQWSRYEKWRVAYRKDLMTGPQGDQFTKLVAYLDAMTMESASGLIDAVKSSAWLSAADVKTKYDALSLINDKIIKLRESAGLPPFDDSLPFTDETPTAFQVIRKHLLGVGSHD